MAEIKITPYKKNAKKHSKKQIEAVAKSIKEFGFNQPIVVDSKGVIIVGHGRYEAAKSLGMLDKDIPVIVANLTPKQAAAYRLADNKLNESDWDMDLVIEEMKSLGANLMELTGFDISKLSDEMNENIKKANKEINIKTVASHLVHECPKCGFKFGK